MTETPVTFPSAGLKLSGVVHVPDVRPGERRPAFLVLHGFGSNKSGERRCSRPSCSPSLGYVALRFDMRGCGESEGARGTSDLPGAGRGHQKRADVSRQAARRSTQTHRA